MAAVLKTYLVNTLTAVVFFQPILGVYEILMGLSPGVVLANRAISALYMFAMLGLVQGWWRNSCFRFTHTTARSSKVRKAFIEIGANMTYQIPVYTSILLLTGVSLATIPRIVLPGTILCTGLAPIFGRFQDAVRRRFGVTPAAKQYV